MLFPLCPPEHSGVEKTYTIQGDLCASTDAS